MMIVRFFLATASIFVGIAGLLLPILPGWLFFGVAALLLFPETRLAQKFLTRIEHRFPSIGRVMRRLMEG
ncbi:MAG TPA: hypothetical protein VER58_03445 [Thermoanaerobaculia bacterium]|nr:hypothetical protein [Thermoanaerobaculia bacterium]